jgi:hypothetical protein
MKSNFVYCFGAVNLMRPILVYFFLLLSFSHPARAGVEEIIYLTSNYLAFYESEFDLYLHSPDFALVREAFPDNSKGYQSRIQQYQKYYSHFLEIQESKLSDRELIPVYSRYLKYFLMNRFSFIETVRTNCNEYQEITKNLKRGDLVATTYVPSWPHLMKDYQPGTPAHVRALAQLNDYQYFSFVIKHLIDLIPLNAISEQTELLLRASFSLHPFLKGETDDPGYPELAFHRSKDSSIPSGDFGFYADYITANTSVDISVRSLGGKNKTFPIILTKNEALKKGSCPPLPSINWLYALTDLPKKSSALKPSIQLEDRFFDDPIDRKAHLKTRNKILNLQKKNAQNKAKNKRLLSLQKDQQGPSEITDPSDLELTESRPRSELSQINSDLSQENKNLLLPIHSETNPTQNEEEATLENETQYIPARGNRVFHEKQEGYQKDTSAQISAINRLSKSQLCWLKDLFHHRLKTVRFRDFKQVWIVLNGTNSIVTSGGSSHHRLLNEQGDTISGIFAHSDAQEYSKGYHSYLRDAFFLSGISKKDL